MRFQIHREIQQGTQNTSNVTYCVVVFLSRSVTNIYNKSQLEFSFKIFPKNFKEFKGHVYTSQFLPIILCLTFPTVNYTYLFIRQRLK